VSDLAPADTIATTGAVPFLEVQACGTYREIGRAVGEAARSRIAAALEHYREHFASMAGIDFATARRRAQGYLVYARRHLPQYVDELEGVAEGAGEPFSDILVPNCGEEFTCPIDRKERRLAVRGAAGPDERAEGGGAFRRAAPACTAVAVAAGGRHIVGHNMDWHAVDVDKNVLFDITCPDGTRFVTIAGVPYLPILGLNSHGLAYVGNSVYSADARLGVPNVFVRRWALEAATLDEARTRAALPARARGSNHLWGDREGTIRDLETSAGAGALLDPQDVADPGGATTDAALVAAHTNHYQHPDMQPFEGYWADESRDRLARAEETLRDGLADGDDPLAIVTRALRDHAAGYDSICSHLDTEPPPDKSITVASMICDLDDMRIHVCAGPPCRNSYRSYSL
jgi:isopenicillin-N N-acyltransferase-like protein